MRFCILHSFIKTPFIIIATLATHTTVLHTTDTNMASTSTTTDPSGFPATAVTSAAPPNEYAVTAKEPAPSAPPIPGMGTDAHSAQEALDKVAQEPSFLGKVANMAQPVC